MTRSGAVIGTPEYMSPEQARALPDIGPSADLFSLGCVLYECLVGRSPFAAEHIAAVLAKILFDPTPRIRERRPEVPRQLVALIERLLEKAPASRPADAATVHTELTQLSDLAAVVAARPQAESALLSHEQQLVSILVATHPSYLFSDQTLVPAEAAALHPSMDLVQKTASAFGGRADLLADGSLVVTLARGHSEATDQARQAARCALALRELWPDCLIALATGRGELDAQLPIGEALDRAGHILSTLQRSRRPVTDRILLDEVTTLLVAPRFHVEQTDDLYLLDRERADEDSSRPLLGRPTPCVGREQELGILEATLDACIEEEAPRAVLVTAPAGLGKSRLRHEFLRRVHTSHKTVKACVVYGRSLAARSAYSLLGMVVRQLCAVRESDLIEERGAALRLRTAQLLPPAEAQRVALFLGEICDAQLPDEGDVRLRAARQDPRIMGDQIQLAVLTFLRAECERCPLLLVLEDLHWGDSLSLRLIERALRELTDSPLMILGLSRPESERALAPLWAGLAMPISLRPLSRKACERLALQALPDLSATRIRDLSEQAAGNPLILEEMIRARARGHGETLPDSVIAVLQARIGQLDRDARHTLIAGSVLGEVFQQEGVARLLGPVHPYDLGGTLRALVQQEILTEREERRFPDSAEFSFRHTLMREAAYGLLTETDRGRAHRIALLCAQELGERDAAVLLEHAARCDTPSLAVPLAIEAAQRAVEGNDLSSALAHAQRGIQCGAAGEDLGALHAITAAAFLWHGQLQEAYAAGQAALALLTEGGPHWCRTMLSLFFATTYLGESEHFRRLIREFRRISPSTEATAPYVEAAAFLVTFASLVGESHEAEHFLGRLLSLSDQALTEDSAALGWVRYAHGVYCHWIENNLWKKKELAQRAIAAANQVGDRRMHTMSLVSLGLAQMALGAFEEGTESFRSALATAHTLPDETYLLGSAHAFFAMGLCTQEDPALRHEVKELAEHSIRAMSPTAPAAGMAHDCLARIELLAGNPELAAEHARTAIRILQAEPAVAPLGYATLSRALLQTGRTAEAIAVAEEGAAIVARLGRCGTEVDILAALAEARCAAADEAGAATARAEAEVRLLRSAGHIPDAAVRERYLARVPLHARLRAQRG